MLCKTLFHHVRCILKLPYVSVYKLCFLWHRILTSGTWCVVKCLTKLYLFPIPHVLRLNYITQSFNGAVRNTWLQPSRWFFYISERCCLLSSPARGRLWPLSGYLLTVLVFTKNMVSVSDMILWSQITKSSRNSGTLKGKATLH